VYQQVRNHGSFLELSPAMKQDFLSLPATDVQIDGQTSPMMVAITRTTASLAKCFEGSTRKIVYPVI